MISLRSVKPWRLCNRRVCAGIALFSYMTTIFGFPLPAAMRQESKACGCPIDGPDVACCCTTGQPDAVAEESAAEVPTPLPPRSCCAKGELEHPKGQPKARPVAREAKKPTDPGAGLRWVLGISASRCQGQSMLWINSGAVTAPPPPVHLSCAPLDFVGRVPDLQSDSCRLSVGPLDPPPRGS
jgi:hypothetical protein